MARWNRATAALPPSPWDLKSLRDNGGSAASHTTQSVINEFRELLARITTLLVTPGLRSSTFVLIFTNFVNSLIYFALAFYAVEIEGSAYVNFALVSAVEFIVTPLLIAVLAMFTRRSPFALCQLGAGLALAAIASTDALGWQVPSAWIVALATVGRLLITMSFTIVYVLA